MAEEFTRADAMRGYHAAKSQVMRMKADAEQLTGGLIGAAEIAGGMIAGGYLHEKGVSAGWNIKGYSYNQILGPIGLLAGLATKNMDLARVGILDARTHVRRDREERCARDVRDRRRRRWQG